MKILLHGSAPWSATGYSVQTGLFAPRLQALGHDIAVACWYGFDGGMLGNPNIPGPNGPIRLYPKGYTEYSYDALPAYYKQFQADVCITILDAWVAEPSVFTEGERWIPLFPVDCEPLAPLVKKRIVEGADRYVISRFGERVCKEAGVAATYIPAAYHEAYEVEGERLEHPDWEGKYVVGVVAANKGWPCRKNWPQIFEGFALFAQQVPNAHLHVHSKVGREDGGIDLKYYAEEVCGLEGKITYTDPLSVHAGIPHSLMARFYRAFDVLLNPAMGEGFCVPLVEAQACGTLVIAGDWTAMTEVTKTGVLIPKSAALRWNWAQPSVTNQWIPTPEAIRDALVQAYAAEWPNPSEISALVQEYSADRVVEEHWKPALERLEQRKPTMGPNREQRRRAKIRGKAAAR